MGAGVMTFGHSVQHPWRRAERFDASFALTVMVGVAVAVFLATIF
jgi:hypothetical protein